MASAKSEPLRGICHVCNGLDSNVKWCRVCGHWIGDCCRYKPLDRVMAALGSGRYDGCCGPLHPPRKMVTA